jgi:hypothetical protein
MPSIVGKRRGNQTYYYLVESARVDGKPRIVSQQYLGSAEEVLAKLSGEPAGLPVRSQHKRFGDVAAVWSILDGLDVVGLVDAVVPRHAHAGASVGTYLALTTLNRGGGPALETGFLRLVGHHHRPTTGEGRRYGVGSSPVLGRHGPAARG